MSVPGCEDAASHASSLSRTVKSVSRRMHESLQAEASKAFLRAVHAAFPSAGVDVVGMLDDFRGKLRLERDFSESKWRDAFRRARDVFVSTTLREPLPARAPEAGRIMWSPQAGVAYSPDYTSLEYNALQVDCLVKIAVDGPITWAMDPATSSWSSLRFVAAGKGDHVPRRTATQVGRSWRRASGASDDSTCTAAHYAPDAAHYVVGEVYYPLADDSAGCGGDPSGVQKLLQLERIVQFLMHKEAAASACDCVAGAVLIGPKFNNKARRKLVAELAAHSDRFPCLTTLQAQQRLLTLEVADAAMASVQLFRQLEAQRSAAAASEEARRVAAAAVEEARRVEAAAAEEAADRRNQELEQRLATVERELAASRRSVLSSIRSTVARWIGWA